VHISKTPTARHQNVAEHVSSNKQVSRDERGSGSDLIRTDANFGKIGTGSNCNFFQNWRIRTESDWENFFWFKVMILNISKI